jgi:hypothetical protein
VRGILLVAVAVAVVVVRGWLSIVLWVGGWALGGCTWTNGEADPLLLTHRIGNQNDRSLEGGWKDKTLVLAGKPIKLKVQAMALT